MDEALLNAPEAILLYAETIEEEGRTMPPGRTLSELKADPTFAEEARDHLVAIVQVPEFTAAAAE
jgi:hypothetical protein